MIEEPSCSLRADRLRGNIFRGCEEIAAGWGEEERGGERRGGLTVLGGAVRDAGQTQRPWMVPLRRRRWRGW
eukprot:COSAG03_NODE_21367_length_305_cov_0.679612_1_plen_71_part_10